MADLLRIKNNIRKMVDMEAPESDIDRYIVEEGTTIDKIKNFKENESEIKKRPDLIYAMAGITPEELAKGGAQLETQGKKFQAGLYYGGGALQSAARDILTIPAHFINQRLLNYPRSITRTAGFEYPEKAEDKGIETIAKGAGVVGAIGSPATKFLANLGIAPKGATLLTKMGRGAIGGAVAGAAYAPSNDVIGLKERAGTAVVSGLAGGAIPPVVAGVKKVGEGMQKLGQTFKVLRGPNQTQINADIGKIESEIDVAQAASKGQKLGIASRELAEKKVLNDYMNEATNMFEENRKTLTNRLDIATEKGVKGTRRLLREMWRSASEIYGNVLEAINDNLVKSGQGMTQEEFLNIYSNTLQKAQEGALPASRMSASLNRMAKRFGVSFDDAGNLVTDNPEGVINFKDLVGSIKTMRKGLSTNFKQGIEATPDDVIFDMFQDEYGKWVAKNAPDFAKLQAEYAPIAELKRNANRIFKPYDIGETQTSKGAQFLRKFGVAREGEKQGEKRLLSAIEKGFELQGKKIGGKQGMFTDIESVGQTLRELAEEKDYVTTSLKNKLDTMQFNNKAQRIAIENELAKKMEGLNSQKMMASLDLKKRADADRLVKWLVGAGLTAVGAKTYGLTRLTKH